jgi:hypothetical protein
MADDMRNSEGRIRMDSREWFILGIRIFGIWLLTRGVGYFASFVDFRFGLTGTSGELSPNSYLYYAACELALAAYFLVGARHLAGICERGGVSDEKQQDEEIDHHREKDAGMPEEQR